MWGIFKYRQTQIHRSEIKLKYTRKRGPSISQGERPETDSALIALKKDQLS
jgi:hypothetical protein